MNLDSCFQLGQIIKAHGLKGAVTADFDVDHPEQYAKLESVFLEINQKLIPFFIEEINISSKRVILKFEDINRVEDVEPLLKKALYLPLESSPEPSEEDLFYTQIIGFKVHDKNLGELGIVEDVLERAGQDLVLMQFQGKEILIPIDKSIILEADENKKVLVVDLPEGLLDLYN